MILFNEIVDAALNWANSLGKTTVGPYSYFGADSKKGEILIKVDERKITIKIEQENLVV